MVEFGCVGAEKKWDTVCGFVVLWFCGCGLHRKIRPTQLWVELSWVVAINHKTYKNDVFGSGMGPKWKTQTHLFQCEVPNIR